MEVLIFMGVVAAIMIGIGVAKSNKQAEQTDSWVEETTNLIQQRMDDERGVSFSLIEAPCPMKRGEQAVLCLPVTEYKYKNTGRGGYHGPTARIKLAKGIYYRAGVGRVAMEKDWAAEDHGQLVFTNQRVVFIGSRGTTSLALNKTFLEHIASNLVEFRRDRGANKRFGADITPEQASTIQLLFASDLATS